MASIDFFSNRIWKNWQNTGNTARYEELFHSGYKMYPPSFVKDSSKVADLGPYKAVAEQMKNDGIEILAVVGIGGSSLGGKAIHNLFNAYSDRIFFWEGPHPSAFYHMGKTAESRKVGLLWISKSGSTLETRTNLALFRQFFPGTPEYFVTSNPEKIADLNPPADKIFVFPEDLGGRFSMVSPVGIIPGFFLGADMEGFVQSFQSGIEQWDVSIPTENNAAKQIASQYFSLLENRFEGVVFWVYAAEMMGWGRWLVQLWGESLGKRSNISALPYLAQGPEDQHSMLQFFLEASNSYMHTFVHVGGYGVHDTVVPQEFPGEFGNHTLWEILQAQQKSIGLALSENLRPVSEFTLPGLEMQNMGRWFALWMYVVTYLGYLYEINPFDQPAVEKGKIYCKKLLAGSDVEPAVSKVLEF